MSLQAGAVARTNPTGFMEGDEGNEVFGPSSRSEFSGVVQVHDEPVVVRAHGLRADDAVLVELVDGKGAGVFFSPLMRGGEQVRLTAGHNQIAIGTPGRYRFVLRGQLGAVYVRQFRASMSHEFLMEYLAQGEGFSPQKAAGVFVTCAGQPHVPGDAVPTCAEVDAKIAAAAVPPLSPAQIAGVFKTCAGAPHAADDSVPTCQEMNAAIAAAGSDVTPEDIAAVFNTCAGSPHAPGDSIPTCNEMHEEIAKAIYDAMQAPREVQTMASLGNGFHGGTLPAGPIDARVYPMLWQPVGSTSNFSSEPGASYVIGGRPWQTFKVSKTGLYNLTIGYTGALKCSAPDTFVAGEQIRMSLYRRIASGFVLHSIKNSMNFVSPVTGDFIALSESNDTIAALQAGVEYAFGLDITLAKPGGIQIVDAPGIYHTGVPDDGSMGGPQLVNEGYLLALRLLWEGA